MKMFFILCIASITSFYGQEITKPDDILGTWSSNLEKGHVEIFRQGDHYFGKIVWLKKPTYEDGTAKLDKKNPDKSSHLQPLMGLCVLKNLVFVKDHWETGTIYDPESGKTYSCRISIKDNTMELRGYIGISMIGRTQSWTRLTPLASAN